MFILTDLVADDIRMYVETTGSLQLICQTDDSTIGIGAAYGTAKSGIGISGVGTFRPDLIMKVNLLTTRKKERICEGLTWRGISP